jgi:acetoin utilization deacetylase AcuC-like enzyme
VSALAMVEQRACARALQPWLLSRAGERLAGQDHDRRLSELRAGLARHPHVRPVAADVLGEEVERTLMSLHEPAFVDALTRVRCEEPVLLADFAAPGMEPDTPVCATVAAAAFEGVRTAIAAARRILDGERFAYALCRPPGHHAGPAWLGGCCYFNNAAAAAHTLAAGGIGRVAILDLDIHYPNGTAALLGRMRGVSLHSLHAWPVVNVAAQTAQPCGAREQVVEFRRPPDDELYLETVADIVGALSWSTAAIVLSLGYDTVAGDPHGGWGFQPEMFARIGRVLSNSALPVCVVQEGGYALGSLAACGYAFASGLLAGEARTWEATAA